MHLPLLGSWFAIPLIIAQSLPVQGTRGSSKKEPRSLATGSGNETPNRKMIAARSAHSLRTRQASINNFLKFDHVLPFVDGMSAAERFDVH